MKKEKFLNNVAKIRSNLEENPRKALEDLNLLSKVSVPLQDAEIFQLHIFFARAMAQFALNNFSQAIQQSTHYISRVNTDTDTDDTHLMFCLRGRAYLAQDEPEKALQDFKSADEATEDDFDLELNKHIADALLRLERFEDAIAILEKIRLLAPAEDLSCLLALAYTKKGAHREAIRVLSEASENQPDSIGILCQLGEAYFKNREYEEAEAVFTTAITLDSNNPFLYRQRAIVRKQLGDRGAEEDWLLSQLFNTEEA